MNFVEWLWLEFPASMSALTFSYPLIQVQQSPKSPHFLSPEDGVSAAVESYNPRGSASFIEQRQAAKECKWQSVIISSMSLLVETFLAWKL